MPAKIESYPGKYHSPDRVLYICIALLSALVCFVHLSNFSLSIDEEMASFATGNSVAWISQGRWGMALIQMLLPYSSAIPLISTLVFILTASAASQIFASNFTRNRGEALIFAGFFVTSPIWLHVVEFNTLAAGAGVGLLATALAVTLIRSERIILAVGAGLCVGFAIGVYQALVIVYALCCIAILFRDSHFWSGGAPTSATASKRLAGLVVISFVIAFGFYFLTQRISLLLTHQHSQYIDSWIQIDQLSTDFHPTVQRILNQVTALLLGTDPTYLGWGRPMLLLPAYGFLCGLYLCMRQGISDPLRTMVSLFALALMIAACSVLVVMASGRMPTRALIGFPMLFAFLALNGYRLGNGMIRWAQWAGFGYAMLIAAWIGASLFYADTVARERDQLLATRLASMIDAVGLPAFGNEIPFVLVGEHTFSDKGTGVHVQIFGTSFFEQDGGNPYRVAAYMKLLGIGGLQPLPITAVSDKLREIKHMPSWPAAGSVAVVGQVVVVKLGDISYQQQLSLSNIKPLGPSS
jgi:hypothetical protein